MISKFDFGKIKKLKELDITAKNLKVGDYFLFGEKMCDQIENINESNQKYGQDVSYYKVIKIRENGNILYGPVMDEIGEK